MKKLLEVIFILFLLTLSVGCVTPLHTASSAGDTKAVVELLDKGKYDINEQRSGFTPLMFAAANGRSDIVRLLLERGADIHATGRGGDALFWAAEGGHADVVKLLIDRGSDIDAAITSLEICVNGTGGVVWNDNMRAGCKAGFISLKRLAEKQRTSRQTETTVTKPSQEAYLAIKSDVDELPVIKTKRNKNAYAIVIGIENYRQKLPRADYAAADAKIIAEYLTKTMGFPEENVITLINDRALKSDLEKYFDRWLSNNVEENGRVFIYYSGHGAPNTKTGDAYLVPYDGDPTFITETGYPITRLYESLGKLKAKDITVILDSCFSGGGGRSVLAKGAKPLVLTINMPAIRKNMSVITASSGDQISSAYEEQGHGLFTYFLLKGIKDENVIQKDGSIKMDNLFNYVKPQVERIARKQFNNEQTPQLWRGKVTTP